MASRSTTRWSRRDVVLLRAEQPGVFGGLPADQGAARRDTGVGDARDDGGDTFGNHPAAGDVVGDEQRFGAADHQIVDEHADQVEPDGVVAVEGLSDGDLRAHPVGGGRQHRMGISLQRRGVEESGEAAEPAQHLGTAGAGHGCLHEFDGAVTGLDVDSGGGVGGLVHFSSR